MGDIVFMIRTLRTSSSATEGSSCVGAMSAVHSCWLVESGLHGASEVALGATVPAVGANGLILITSPRAGGVISRLDGGVVGMAGKPGCDEIIYSEWINLMAEE